jgi:hypothetical protein
MICQHLETGHYKKRKVSPCSCQLLFQYPQEEPSPPGRFAKDARQLRRVKPLKPPLGASHDSFSFQYPEYAVVPMSSADCLTCIVCEWQ